jgi:large subunit ribosomal protein L32
MGVPKRKTSKARIRRRKHSSNHQVDILGGQPCPKCGVPVQSHRVCAACGNYRDRQVLRVETD